MIFCKHNFIKEKNNLFCNKCGKYVRMKCDHKWKSVHNDNITTHIGGVHVIETLICEICGHILFVNHTTQELNDEVDAKINVKYEI